MGGPPEPLSQCACRHWGRGREGRRGHSRWLTMNGGLMTSGCPWCDQVEVVVQDERWAFKLPAAVRPPPPPWTPAAAL